MVISNEQEKKVGWRFGDGVEIATPFSSDELLRRDGKLLRVGKVRLTGVALNSLMVSKK